MRYQSLIGMAILGVASLSGLVTAHELKIFANRLFVPEERGRVTVFLADGHRVPVDNLIDEAAVGRFDLLAPGGTTTELKRSGVSIHTNSVDLRGVGVHQVVASRKPSVWTYVIEADGERHLRRGSKREHAGQTLDSAIRYEQHAKSFIVVGEPGPTPPKPTGLPVEIVALDGPNRWTANKDIRFQALQDGKPVAIAGVVARYVGFKPDDAWCFATETDRKGKFTVRPDRAGTWIIGVEYRNPSKGDARESHDFESFATTVTLEVLP